MNLIFFVLLSVRNSKDICRIWYGRRYWLQYLYLFLKLCITLLLSGYLVSPCILLSSFFLSKKNFQLSIFLWYRSGVERMMDTDETRVLKSGIILTLGCLVFIIWCDIILPLQVQSISHGMLQPGYRGISECMPSHVWILRFVL